MAPVQNKGQCIIQESMRKSAMVSPRSLKIVEDLKPVLASLNYGETEIHSLVKECNHDQDRIQEAVGQLLDTQHSEPLSWAHAATASEKKVKAQQNKERREHEEKAQAEERERMRAERKRLEEESAKRRREEAERRRLEETALRLGRKPEAAKAPVAATTARSSGRAWGRVEPDSSSTAAAQEAPGAATTGAGSFAESTSGGEDCANTVEVDLSGVVMGISEGEEEEEEEDCVVIMPGGWAELKLACAEFEDQVRFGSFDAPVAPSASSGAAAPAKQAKADEASDDHSEHTQPSRGRSAPSRGEPPRASADPRGGGPDEQGDQAGSRGGRAKGGDRSGSGGKGKGRWRDGAEGESGEHEWWAKEDATEAEANGKVEGKGNGRKGGGKKGGKGGGKWRPGKSKPGK